ncbi:MAG TPA: hypothetical protein VLN44_05765, partial [Pyrinomonadaceae bacterium]|nr:hypothetical protein [Pyrinomonadaceae bacterium]
ERKPAATRRFLYLWLAAALVVFSLSSFKLDYYLLPIMPAAALIVAPAITHATDFSKSGRRLIKLFFALTAIAVLVVSLISLRVAAVLGINNSLRLLPLLFAAVGFGAVGYCLVRRSAFATAIVLCVCIAATMLSLELTFLPGFTRFLLTKELVSTVPGNRVWFTSPAAGDWANDLAFNLPPGHTVERLTGNHVKVVEIFRNNPDAVVLMREREFNNLAAGELNLKILGQAETYGHGGPRLTMLPNPQREVLLVIGR